MQVRLMLVLAPASCCLAGIATHEVMLTLTRSVRAGLADRAAARDAAAAQPAPAPDKGTKGGSFKSGGPKGSRKNASSDGSKVRGQHGRDHTSMLLHMAHI